MKHLGPILVRLFLVTTLALTLYLVFSSPSFAPRFAAVLSLFSYKASSLNLNSESITSSFKQKLIDQQSIIADQGEVEIHTDIMGTSTSIVTQQAKDFVSTTAEKIVFDLRALPKEQAVSLVRQTCEQIISELEK